MSLKDQFLSSFYHLKLCQPFIIVVNGKETAHRLFWFRCLMMTHLAKYTALVESKVELSKSFRGLNSRKSTSGDAMSTWTEQLYRVLKKSTDFLFL